MQKYTGIHFQFILAFMLFIFGAVELRSQDNTVAVPSPPTPEMAAMVKHLEIPVGEFSGSANVNISLYQAAYKEIQVPISLSYHSMGLK